MTRRSINLAQFWLSIGLFSLPVVSFGIAAYIRFRTALFPAAEVNARSYLIFTVLVTLLWALVVEHLDLNSVSTILTLRTGICTAAKASFYCTVLSLSPFFFYRAVIFARIFVIAGCILLFVLSVFLIHLFRWILYATDRSPNGRFPIAILGVDHHAAAIARSLSQNQVARCNVACFVALPGQESSLKDVPVIAWDRIEDVVDSFHCSEILICLPPDRISQARKILQSVQHLCIPARMVLDLGEGIFVQERVFDYYGIPLLDLRPYPIDTVEYCIGKRVFDIAFSITMLLVCAPLMLVVAVAIKLTSRGPVFFLQDRVSLNGRQFKMIKFRSMYVQDTRTSDECHTARFDKRVTPVGRLLRRMSIDEFPQFLNVLKGDMSVVGPRPELIFFVQKFRHEIPWYMARHNVKCGITGWAQVNGLRGSATSILQRIEYDLYYMQNWSILLDLRIILMTIVNGMLASQAY